jgi:hypothetical protein
MLAALAAGSMALADDFTLDWWTVDGEVDLKDYNYLCNYWMQYYPDNWPSW